MDFNFKNKIFLITGSSRGIGFEVAKKLSSFGAVSVLNGRSREDLQNAKKEIPYSFAVCADLSKQNDSKYVVEEIIKKYGKLDGIICNIGSGRSLPPGDETIDEWRRVFDLNFWSAVNIITEAKKSIINSKGSIVCISSICGNEIIPSAPVTYSVAKSALNHFIKGISRPFGAHGVRINGVSPGNIKFNGSVWEKKLDSNPEEVKNMLKNEVPLQTLGDTEDIANLVAFLLSDYAKFITGEIITSDGGQTRN